MQIAARPRATRRADRAAFARAKTITPAARGVISSRNAPTPSQLMSGRTAEKGPRRATWVWSWLGFDTDTAGDGSVRTHQRWPLHGLYRHCTRGGWVAASRGGGPAARIGSHHRARRAG